MNRRKSVNRALCLIVLLALSVAASQASILIAFDNPFQIGKPGNTLTFTGVVSNGGSGTVFLNSDTLNLLGGNFAVNDLFFSNVPISLDPGQSSGTIDLFEVHVSDPFPDAPGLYTGTYSVLGGVDFNAQVVVGQSDFSVTVNPVPEPASMPLVTGALVASMCILWSRRNSCKPQKRRGCTANL
jgi:hypothetical protein